jgi:hypothetical protein
MQHRWNDKGRGKMKHWEKDLSQCHFTHHKSHVNQLALRWLKVRYDVEDLECSMRENTLHFPFLIWLSDGDWWVLISEWLGEGTIQGFFQSLQVTLWDSDFGFLFVKISLVRLASRCGRLQPRVPVE